MALPCKKRRQGAYPRQVKIALRLEASCLQLAPALTGNGYHEILSGDGGIVIRCAGLPKVLRVAPQDVASDAGLLNTSKAKVAAKVTKRTPSMPGGGDGRLIA